MVVVAAVTRPNCISWESCRREAFDSLQQHSTRNASESRFWPTALCGLGLLLLSSACFSSLWCVCICFELSTHIDRQTNMKENNKKNTECNQKIRWNYERKRKFRKRQRGEPFTIRHRLAVRIPSASLLSPGQSITTTVDVVSYSKRKKKRHKKLKENGKPR